ncbi:MAG: F0F1 ATP synthase subunit A, partial [Balneolaceae bacterium]
MSQNLRRLAAILLFLLVIHPTVLAAQTDDGDENIIDVLGKVVDHDYFETPFGKIYLPRILLADGELYVYANTQSAIDSEEFISEDGVL